MDKIYKNNRIFSLVLIFVLFLLLFSVSNNSCKNIDEYEPRFDSLSPPPPPPQLISPKNDTIFYFQSPHPNEIKLRWSVVENVEYYQLQIANDSTILPNANPQNIETCSTTYTVVRNGFFFWRVRAYSSKWTWYTDWSETWHFGAFYSP